MSNNLVNAAARFRDNGGNQGHNGGSNPPPEGPSMEARVTALETRLESVATKADLHEASNNTTKWVIGTWLASLAILLSLLSFMFNKIDRDTNKPAAQPSAPIIIQVPAYQAPADQGGQK